MSGGNLGIYLTLVLYSLPGLILGFTLHELAHAFTAVRLGDPTPRMQGRITADPRQHIDPLGFGLLLIVGFGWAKPVQFSTAYILFAVAIKIQLGTGATPQFQTFGHGGLADILFAVLVQSFFINVVLFVFNSLPVPGLDGYMVARGLLGGILPDLFRWMDRNSQVVIVVAIALVFLLPQITGAPSPLGTLIVDVNNRLYHTFVDPNSTVVGGLPSITQLFSSSL
jgi:Zn-dependent protease